MRNIDVPGAKEIFAKQEELLSTFVQNKAFVKAMGLIYREVKKDFVEAKMQKVRDSAPKKSTPFMSAEEYYSSDYWKNTRRDF